MNKKTIIADLEARIAKLEAAHKAIDIDALRRRSEQAIATMPTKPQPEKAVKRARQANGLGMLIAPTVAGANIHTPAGAERTWRNLTKGARGILVRMALDNAPTPVKVIGFRDPTRTTAGVTNAISVLVGQGVLTRPERGLVDFANPFMRELVRGHIDASRATVQAAEQQLANA